MQSRAQAVERNRTALRREAQSIRAEQIASASQLQAELTQLDRSLAALDQEGIENDGRRQIVITAAQDGNVTAQNVKGRTDRASRANGGHTRTEPRWEAERA